MCDRALELKLTPFSEENVAYALPELVVVHIGSGASLHELHALAHRVAPRHARTVAPKHGTTNTPTYFPTHSRAQVCEALSLFTRA